MAPQLPVKESIALGIGWLLVLLRVGPILLIEHSRRRFVLENEKLGI
jgi:hypothetical protein